ncbi:major facilitator superfamily domain-containing protein 12-like isoform X1 [Parasteatoda tepidariorum]|uniref:major facilitator superfamily domain-containing protein 12-like isoform X1 n=1 Tax=Parasteatoda tepidariorum TaxID=114398 RepID=UPI0039BD2FFC
MAASTKLTWAQRISYGVGHSLNDLCSTMWFSYLIIYLQLVLGFNSNYAGLILLIGQTVDAIATPLLGYEASHPRQSKICKKYGRRKFMHLIGTICVVVSFPFIFSSCPGCNKASPFAMTILLIPLVIIFQVGWAAVQVSHMSLIPAITPHESERDFLNVLRYAINTASDIGTYVIVWAVFDLTRQPTGDVKAINNNYAEKFLVIVLIVVGVGSFFSIMFHIGVKEVPSQSAHSSEKDDDSIERQKEEEFRKNIHLSWRGWIREKHFYQVSLLYMLTRLFQNMGMVFMPLYLQESLKANSDFIAKIPLVMNISGFVVSCTLPKFFRVLSKKVTFLAGTVLAVGGCAWISVGEGDSFCSQGIYGVGVMLGAAASMLIVSSLSFTHDLIGTSSESGAFVYGCMSFWDKIANGIAGMLVQYIHSETCQNCDWFYKDVMSYGVGGTAILASLVLATLLPANLGKRTSSYNEIVGVTSEEEKINYHSIDKCTESTPILQDH